MLASSWRFREVDPETGAAGPPIRRATNEIYALWHQQLLMLMLRHRDEDIAVMISRSSDGDLATPVVEGLGFRVVRGSSSRGGSRGLTRMVEASAAGHSLSLTVDGPRGPARVCKPGAVLIASRAGIPVVPTVAIPVRGRAVNSWDRFLIPYPGTAVYVAYGQPIDIPPDLSSRQVETWQDRVGSELESLVALCELAAGRSWPRRRAS
jgi:lysophospholipid acyltransferase (LPLAT)-like uncharacterized protein